MGRVEIEERMKCLDARGDKLDYEIGCLQHEQDTIYEEYSVLEDKLSFLDEQEDALALLHMVIKEEKYNVE